MSTNKSTQYGETNDKDIKKVYDIQSFGHGTDPNGNPCFLALASCGTTITARKPREDFYEVFVEGPDEKRTYAGGPESDACKTFTNISKLVLNRSRSMS